MSVDFQLVAVGSEGESIECGINACGIEVAGFFRCWWFVVELGEVESATRGSSGSLFRGTFRIAFWFRGKAGFFGR